MDLLRLGVAYGRGKNMKPEQILNEGKKILDPFMVKNGFKFVFAGSGQGSGGNYCVGKYVKQDRTLELNVRYDLGLVNYKIGDVVLYHPDYMKLLKVYGKNKYPGFSDNPVDAFKDLLFDLEHFSKDFISGYGDDFKKLVALFAKNPDVFKGMPWIN